MADRYSPFWDPRKVLGSPTGAQETEAGPMPTSLSWGLPTACQVVSDMVIQMKNLKKKKKKKWKSLPTMKK